MFTHLAQGNRLWRVGLFALALFTLAKSLIWVVVNPPLNSGDETAHLMYVMQLRNTGALPVFKFAPDCSTEKTSTPPDPAALKFIQDRGYAVVVPFTIAPYESYQAPLYYLACAVVALPLAHDDALGVLYASRIVSALLAVATVIITAYAIRELTLKPWLALGGAALLSSIPVFGYFGGLANNDNMLNLFAAATSLAALRVLRTPGTMLVPCSLLLGVLAGGATLSKASGLGLVPVGLLALAFGISLSGQHEEQEQEQGEGGTVGPWRMFWTGLRTASFWRRMLGLTGLYLAAFLVVAGWWLARNLVVYGDLTATANQVKYVPACWWGATIASQGPVIWLRYLMSIALLTPFSFFATFGWGDESVGTTFYYAVILPLLLLDVYFAARWLARHGKTLRPFQRMGLVVLGAQTVIVLLIFLSFNFTVQYQPVGRYLYMALLPITGFLAIGLLMPGGNPRINRALIIGALIGLTALTVGGYMLAGTGWMATHTAQKAHGYAPAPSRLAQASDESLGNYEERHATENQAIHIRRVVRDFVWAGYAQFGDWTQSAGDSGTQLE